MEFCALGRLMERIEFVPAHLVPLQRDENIQSALHLLNLDTDFEKDVH